MGIATWKAGRFRFRRATSLAALSFPPNLRAGCVLAVPAPLARRWYRFESSEGERETNCSQGCHGRNEERVEAEEKQETGADAHPDQWSPSLACGVAHQKIEKEGYEEGGEDFGEDLGGEEEEGGRA